MKSANLLPLLLFPALLCGCQSGQLGDKAAYIKHTKALRTLFLPLKEKERPLIIHQWKYHGSLYTIRACTSRSIHDWLVEVQHPDGSHYCHKTPQPEQSKRLRAASANKIQVTYRHMGEQLILTLNHEHGAQVRLHAHNLGYMADNVPTDSTATATLTQAVQQGGRISLRDDNGKEYRLTDWEQEAMRRILSGAICHPTASPTTRRALCLYNKDGKLLCELPLSEYWLSNHWSAEPGIPTLPTTTLQGNYHRTYLPAWWSGVCLRLHLTPPRLPGTDSRRSGPGTLSAKQLDELFKNR